MTLDKGGEMKKLSKERLLYWVGRKISIINIKEGIVPSEEEVQAYRQICQIIKLHFSEDWQQVKKELGEFMKKQKPEVTVEFIEKWMKRMGCASYKIGDLLKELGVEIVER